MVNECATLPIAVEVIIVDDEDGYIKEEVIGGC